MVYKLDYTPRLSQNPKMSSQDKRIQPPEIHKGRLNSERQPQASISHQRQTHPPVEKYRAECILRWPCFNNTDCALSFTCLLAYLLVGT